MKNWEYLTFLMRHNKIYSLTKPLNAHMIVFQIYSTKQYPFSWIRISYQIAKAIRKGLNGGTAGSLAGLFLYSIHKIRIAKAIRYFGVSSFMNVMKRPTSGPAVPPFRTFLFSAAAKFWKPFSLCASISLCCLHCENCLPLYTAILQ